MGSDKSKKNVEDFMELISTLHPMGEINLKKEKS